MPPKTPAPAKSVATLVHDEAKRLNIPTTEFAAVAPQAAHQASLDLELELTRCEYEKSE